MRFGRRHVVVAAAALAALLALGGLVAGVRSGSDPASERSTSGADAAAPAPSSTIAPSRAADAAAGASGGEEAPATSPGALGGLAAPQAPGRVVKHATLTVALRRDGLDGAVGSVLGTVQSAGGFVVASTEDHGRAELTLRIPSPAFETTLAAIRRIGDVHDESLRGDDVSARYVDLEARLRNWRAQESVLLDLMSRARSIPDTIAVQQQLSQIQQQIEELEGQRRVLDDQTSFGTVTLTLVAPGVTAAGPEAASTLSSAWSDAVGVALAVLGGTLVVLGALLPLGLVAALVLAAWTVVRRRRLRPQRGPSVA